MVLWVSVIFFVFPYVSMLGDQVRGCAGIMMDI
jgi:hypothetical protein